MLILDQQEQPIVLDSIHTPTLTEHYWILDLNMMDFTLTELDMLEEIIAPSIMVQIKGFQFMLPANWNMLVYDTETLQLDIVEIAELAGREFMAFVYGPDKGKPDPGAVKVVDYKPEYQNVAPSLNKHQMLCHPINPNEWVNVAPSDTYNKYLKNCVVGDLV